MLGLGIHRKLRKSGAIMIHESFWKSDNLQDLIEVALTIKKFDGKASILEEKLIF